MQPASSVLLAYMFIIYILMNRKEKGGSINTLQHILWLAIFAEYQRLRLRVAVRPRLIADLCLRRRR